jgi:L-threonylcarbamoyladenylate synthase
MTIDLFKIETPAQFTAAVQRAAELLQRGEVVAVPTETVYGLAANALNPDAVRKIYQAKGRPASNPIIVHVASLPMAQACSSSWPKSANALAAAFWPGPLTLVLPKSSSIPPIVTAGGDTVGLRWPAHPFMQELIRACAFPIAAPSANPANTLSPTSADHVQAMLTGKIPLIVDAGPSNVGIESTVLDLTAHPPRVLRPGMISTSQIAQVLKQDILGECQTETGTLKSPGLLRKHYAPRAKLVVSIWQNDSELRTLAEQSGFLFHQISVIAHEHIPRNIPFGRVSVIPHDSEAYARALYAELHHCDQSGTKLILVEQVPVSEEWHGIRDRLKRASAAE